MHTPGVWIVRKSMHGPKYRCVQIGKDESYTTSELEPDDAKLMAASPLMLEALLEAQRYVDPDSPAGAKVRAAIAKAQG
jgi:hypothetical protein